MTESSFGGDNDLTAGATVEGEDETVDSATADQEAAFDNPTGSAEGNVTDGDALVVNPPDDSADTDVTDEETASSHDADVAAGYDDAESDASS